MITLEGSKKIVNVFEIPCNCLYFQIFVKFSLGKLKFLANPRVLLSTNLTRLQFLFRMSRHVKQQQSWLPLSTTDLSFQRLSHEIHS